MTISALVRMGPSLDTPPIHLIAQAKTAVQHLERTLFDSLTK